MQVPARAGHDAFQTVSGPGDDGGGDRAFDLEVAVE